MRVGVIGCGNISDVYVRNSKLFKDYEIVCCADMAPSAAARIAEKFSLQQRSVDSLLSSEDVDIVLNLTSPQAHAEISRRAVKWGKHVYTEKPLTVSLDDSIALMTEAGEHGVRVGSAPDTILGGGLQTAKAMIDGGETGQIIAGVSAIMHKGAEHWHPNPAFLYRKGAGPILDLGPYYISALPRPRTRCVDPSDGSHRTVGASVLG